MTLLEKSHGINPEPSHMCNSIDSMQIDLQTLVSELEGLRKRIESLREWGQDWRDKASEYYNELENARYRIDELESEARG